MVLRWSFFALAVVAAITAAYMFRYEPLVPNPASFLYVWDRWEHRTCMSTLKSGKKLLCTLEDVRLSEFWN